MASADKRSLLVTLTGEGKQRVRVAFRRDMSLDNKLISDLEPKEQAQLAALLPKVVLGTGAQGAPHRRH
jgi:DNA-binding MarR family transcriptional regulator